MFQVLVKVAIVKHHIQFLMQHFYLLQDFPGSRPPDVVHHVLVDDLQVCPDGDVEIHCAAVLLDVVPAESVDDVGEGSTHRQQIDQLVDAHLALRTALGVEDVDLGDCAFLQEELVGQQQFLLQDEVQLSPRLPFQIVDQLGHQLFAPYSLQQHAVDQDEDFEHVRNRLLAGENLDQIGVILRHLQQLHQVLQLETHPPGFLEVAAEGLLDGLIVSVGQHARLFNLL